MQRSRTLAATLALALTTLLPQVTIAQEEEVAQAPELRPVHVMTVGADTDGIMRQFFGHVVARQTVDLAFQVAGQIVEFPANEGEEVPQGDLVAELDLEPFELELEQAQLRFDQAERMLERMTQLAGTVSEVSREDAETELGLARVGLRNAEYALENATLSAPFDALVASRNIANFTTVQAGTPVVRLHDMSELRIEIDVPEILFQRASDDAEVTLEAQFPTGDARLPLEVREFNAEASSVGQTFRLTLALANRQGISALPGSSVTVFATINTGEGVLTIPATAVRIGNDDSASVMRFVPGDGDTGVLEEIPVTIEPSRNGAVVVTSGLSVGDEIVRTGAQAVEDGATVRRFSDYPN